MSNNKKSFSKVVHELIELGLKLHDKFDQKTSANECLTEKKNTEYLLRILGITADILRCVRNEKSKYQNINTEEVLNIITTNSQLFIDQFTEKS